MIKDITRRKIQFLPADKVRELIVSSGDNKRDTAIIAALFSTGLRISELLSLEREQFGVAPANKTLEVSIVGKGGYSRVVYFSPQALTYIKQWLKERSDKDERLFPITPRTAQRMIKRRADITPHKLRHSFACHLLAQGVDLFTVKEFLGHKNIGTTQIYLHTTNYQLKKLHEKIYGAL